MFNGRNCKVKKDKNQYMSCLLIINIKKYNLKIGEKN